MPAPNRPVGSRAVAGLAPLLVVVCCGTAAGQYGPILTGSGPVNRAMGGVAVAAPLSASSALYWNPATMTGFDRSQLDFGVELLILDTTLSSRFPAGSVGPGVPPVTLAGRTDSNSTVFPLPNVGLVYRPDDSPFAFGLGVHAVAGFGVDYPGDLNNPILSPRPPVGVGVGPVYSDYQVLQLSPSVAYQATDRLSVAVGPNVNLGRLVFEPGLFVPPDDANGDGFATYPAATHSRFAWGGGFTAGLYYRADTWAAGVSYKSPQWFERYRFNATDERGVPRNASVGLDLPMIVSLGVAYTGIDRWVLAADVRYLGYGQVRGFGRSGFAPTGAASGLGFDDTFAAAVGAQYRLSDRLTVRGGYSYGSDPFPGSQASVNIASPTILKHLLTAGVSWDVTEDLTLSLAYVHAFENSVTGPLVTALGTAPGTSVGSSATFDSIVLGASVKFGPGRVCPVAE